MLHRKVMANETWDFFFFFLFFFLVVDFYPSCLQVPHLEHTAGMLILFLVLYKVV